MEEMNTIKKTDVMAKHREYQRGWDARPLPGENKSIQWTAPEAGKSTETGAVLQGSLFGVVGLFPPRYSTLFMSGQGLAGIFAALAMLLSILSNAEKSSAALGYFITPCVATLGTLLCYLLLPQLEFARFYLNRNHSANVETTQELLSSTDLADGCMCDVLVCRHPVGVSCDHGPSSDRLQGQRCLGCNGSLPTGDKGRRKSRFALCRRNTANGVKPSTVHSPGTPQAAKAVSNKEQHSISYTLSRAQTVVVEYTQDSNTDMFQIGRSTETPIDFVVTDTLPGGHGHADGQTVQSTISRFACRIICQRNPPYAVRIYAAGFDSSKNIFLGEKAAKWRMQDGQMDRLTTNGVLVMHPRHGFSQGSKPGLWREMSVCGNVFTLRETRSSQQRGKMVGDSNRLFMGAVVLL